MNDDVDVDDDMDDDDEKDYEDYGNGKVRAEKAAAALQGGKPIKQLEVQWP